MVLDHYLHHDLDMLPLLQCFFAHLLILQYPDHHQNLISSSLYYSGPVHKISSQSVHNFLSNVVHRQNKQTDRQTNQRYQKHILLCQGGNDKRLSHHRSVSLCHHPNVHVGWAIIGVVINFCCANMNDSAKRLITAKVSNLHTCISNTCLSFSVDLAWNQKNHPVNPCRLHWLP